jgi:hypothetical protein
VCTVPTASVESGSVTRFGAPVGPAPKPQPRAKNRKRNDSAWREECLERRGRYCRVCCTLATPHVPGRLEIDHIWPRGQGGPSVVENGLVLCSMHHQAKTESRIKIRFEWLDPDQRAWLADVGWIWWDDAGSPAGHGMKHFAARAA